AAARLPAASRIAVVHLGDALDPGTEAEAIATAEKTPRWVWLRGQRRIRALAILAGSDALVLTSKLEGGANVVTEAIACGVPVISTAIDGSLGILGDDHPGLFPPGDEVALAALLSAAENDRAFYGALAA